MIELPQDSSLRWWVDAFDNTEIWPSWRVATGLGMIGAALGRNIAYPYEAAGKIWPNASIMLVGGSGRGKDTIFRPADAILQDIGVPYIAGKTMEAFRLSLYRVGDPAVGFLVAGELKEFVGSKDYQSGILESITDLLSNNDHVDISNKTDLTSGGPRIIRHPTLTMFAASTPDWLKKIDGVLEGGFLPRFIVAVETGTSYKFVPDPGSYESLEQRDRIRASSSRFREWIWHVRDKYQRYPQDFVQDLEGKYYYDNWYMNRLSYFSPALEAYAFRSGNLMRKIAMLIAISRDHNYIDVVDYKFAGDFVRYSAEQLESAVVHLPREVEIARAAMAYLPATRAELLRILSTKHGGPWWVDKGIKFLLESDQIVVVDGKINKKDKNGISSSKKITQG